MPVTLTSPTDLPLNFLPTVRLDESGVGTGFGPVGKSGTAALTVTDWAKTLAPFFFFLAAASPAARPTARQSASRNTPAMRNARDDPASPARSLSPIRRRDPFTRVDEKSTLSRNISFEGTRPRTQPARRWGLPSAGVVPTRGRPKCATALRPATVPAWQIATANASAAWSGAGGSGSPSRVATIRWTCPLSAEPEPQTAFFTACGV